MNEFSYYLAFFFLEFNVFVTYDVKKIDFYLCLSQIAK